MSRPRVVAIVQARMGSTRLPGKALAMLADRPMMEQIVRRLGHSRHLAELVVATTERPEDEALASLASRLGAACFRGSEHDVLDRYYQAALSHGAQTVVRLTGDNPLVDAAFVDWCLDQFHEADPPLDYLDTGTSRTFPLGLSVEVFTMGALTAAWQEDGNTAWREHVTPFLRHHPERFHLRHLADEADHHNLRWTVDTPEDFAFMQQLYDRLSLGDRPLSYRDVLAYVLQHPELTALNGHVVQRAL